MFQKLKFRVDTLHNKAKAKGNALVPFMSKACKIMYLVIL